MNAGHGVKSKTFIGLASLRSDILLFWKIPTKKMIVLVLLGHPFILENPNIKKPQRNRRGCLIILFLYLEMKFILSCKLFHNFYNCATIQNTSKLRCNFYKHAAIQITSKLAFVFSHAYIASLFA